LNNRGLRELQVTAPILKNIPNPKSLNSKIRVARAKEDQFLIFGLQNGKISGSKLRLHKEKIEDVSSFKMPLMFIGVAVAFIYQICFKQVPNRKKVKSRYKQNQRQEKLKRISSQIRQMENMTKGFQ